jgi:hypothetical protein
MFVFLRILIAGLFVASSTGCAYRLPAMRPASREPIRIIAATPDQYAFRVYTGTMKEYEVPHDGRVIADIPAYRPTCGVYLFNVVRVSGGDDRLRTWNISVIRNGRVVREFSLRQIRKLATDEQEYHLLQIR